MDKKPKKTLICIGLIIIIVLFPLIWLIRFPKSGIVLDAFVNFDGTSWGDNVPASGIPYKVYDMFDNSIVATGTISADGMIYFYPLGVITTSYYRINFEVKNAIQQINLNNGSISASYNKDLSPYMIDGSFLWDIDPDYPTVDTMPVGIYMWNGGSYELMATVTTDALGNADFYVPNGLFTFNELDKVIDIRFDTESPIIDTYLLSPIVILISSIGIIITILALINKKYRLSLRGKNSLYLSIFSFREGSRIADLKLRPHPHFFISIFSKYNQIAILITFLENGLIPWIQVLKI